MLTLASQWHDSGKSQEQFSQENNISAHSLRYWLYKRKDLTSRGGSFVQIKGFTTTEEFLVRYPNGVELKVPAHIPVSVIKALINL
jgi:hypothetical protein